MAASGILPYMVQKAVGVVVLVCYIGIYLRFMLFSRVVVTWKPLLLLEPLWSYRACLYIDWTGLHVTDATLFDQILINYLLFFPLACLLTFTWPKLFHDHSWRGLFLVMGVALACSLSTEVMQYVLKVGYFEIDDLINNVLGAGVGYLIYRAIHALASNLLMAKRL